ncbi:hypothetical protein CBM2623_B170348 [Cupriavidus taiwanensis]|nr:hypothetical protein CBM2623_B170348 [Cupriavidus taiwanensis]
MAPFAGGTDAGCGSGPGQQGGDWPPAPGVAASSWHAAQEAFPSPACARAHQRGHAAGKIYHPM